MATPKPRAHLLSSAPSAWRIDEFSTSRCRCSLSCTSSSRPLKVLKHRLYSGKKYWSDDRNPVARQQSSPRYILNPPPSHLRWNSKSGIMSTFMSVHSTTFVFRPFHTSSSDVHIPEMHFAHVEPVPRRVPSKKALIQSRFRPHRILPLQPVYQVRCIGFATETQPSAKEAK